MDIKSENVRLQRLADILEAQPDLTFLIDRDGRITYISERSTHCIKASMPDDSDDDPSHINQILTPDSVEAVLESVAQVIEAGAGSAHDNDGGGHVSAVKSVCYHDPNGFQARGYLRIARLIRRTATDDGASTTDAAGNNSDSSAAVSGPAPKKSRTLPHVSSTSSTSLFSSSSLSSSDTSVALTASNIAAAALMGPTFANGRDRTDGSGGVGDCDGSSTHNEKKAPSTNSGHSHHRLNSAVQKRGDDGKTSDDEEFVCTIRPADASIPVTGGAFSSLLSTASMVAHDLELRSSGRIKNEDRNGAAEERRVSPSGSHGSSHGSLNGSNGSSFQPNSSKATSSEAGSDDNREEEQDEQEPL